MHSVRTHPKGIYVHKQIHYYRNIKVLPILLYITNCLISESLGLIFTFSSVFTRDYSYLFIRRKNMNSSKKYCHQLSPSLKVC